MYNNVYQDYLAIRQVIQYHHAGALHLIDQCYSLILSTSLKHTVLLLLESYRSILRHFEALGQSKFLSHSKFLGYLENEKDDSEFSLKFGSL